MKAEKKEFLALTGMRAVAAHMVLIHHLIYDKKISLPLAHLYNGFIIFFVLSGFLITYHNYALVSTGLFRFSDYFRKRFARIYPTYLLALIAAELWSPHKETTFTYWLLNLTLFKGWSFKYIYAGIGQAWTLTMEETFYALAPLLFYYLSRRAGGLIFLCAGSLVLGLAHYGLRFSMAENPHLARDFYSYTMTGFPFMFLAFAFGIWGALVELGERRFILARHLTLISAVGLVLSLFALEWAKPFSEPFGIYEPLQTLFMLVAVPFATAILFLGLIRERTFLSRFLGSRPLVTLGKISYANYLFNSGPIATSILTWLTVRTSDASIFIFIVVINILSWLVFALFEEPLARWIRRPRSKSVKAGVDRIIKPAAGA